VRVVVRRGALAAAAALRLRLLGARMAAAAARR